MPVAHLDRPAQHPPEGALGDAAMTLSAPSKMNVCTWDRSRWGTIRPGWMTTPLASSQTRSTVASPARMQINGSGRRRRRGRCSARTAISTRAAAIRSLIVRITPSRWSGGTGRVRSAATLRSRWPRRSGPGEVAGDGAVEPGVQTQRTWLGWRCPVAVEFGVGPWHQYWIALTTCPKVSSTHWATSTSSSRANSSWRPSPAARASRSTWSVPILPAANASAVTGIEATSRP